MKHLFKLGNQPVCPVYYCPQQFCRQMESATRRSDRSGRMGSIQCRKSGYSQHQKRDGEWSVHVEKTFGTPLVKRH